MLEMFTDAGPMRRDEFALPAEGSRANRAAAPTHHQSDRKRSTVIRLGRWTYESTEEALGGVECLENDAEYLERAAKRYRDNGEPWLASVVKANAATHRDLANRLRQKVAEANQK